MILWVNELKYWNLLQFNTSWLAFQERDIILDFAVALGVLAMTLH